MDRTNLTPNSLVLADVVVEELKLQMSDLSTIIALQNMFHPDEKIDEVNDVVRNDGKVFFKYKDVEKIENTFKNDVVSISKMSEISHVPLGNIKYMCDMCYDDRYSSLIDAINPEAKIRPIAINGTYYLTTNYIDHFDERCAAFDKISDEIIEKANEIDEQTLDEMEKVYHPTQEQIEENERKEEITEEEPVTEEEIDEDDTDEKEEKKKKQKEINKKRQELQRKAEERFRHDEEIRLANNRRLQEIAEENNRRANQSSGTNDTNIHYTPSSYNPDNSANFQKEIERNTEIYRKQLENAQAEVKKAEENAKILQNKLSEQKHKEEFAKEQERQSQNNASVTTGSTPNTSSPSEISQLQNSYDSNKQNLEIAKAQARAAEEAYRQTLYTKKLYERLEQEQKKAEELRRQSQNSPSQENRASVADKTEQERIARLREENRIREENANQRRLDEAKKRLDEAIRIQTNIDAQNSALRKIAEDRAKLLERQQHTLNDTPSSSFRTTEEPKRDYQPSSSQPQNSSEKPPVYKPETKYDVPKSETHTPPVKGTQSKPHTEEIKKEPSYSPDTHKEQPYTPPTQSSGYDTNPTSKNYETPKYQSSQPPASDSTPNTYKPETSYKPEGNKSEPPKFETHTPTTENQQKPYSEETKRETSYSPDTYNKQPQSSNYDTGSTPNAHNESKQPSQSTDSPHHTYTPETPKHEENYGNTPKYNEQKQDYQSSSRADNVSDYHSESSRKEENKYDTQKPETHSEKPSSYIEHKDEIKEQGRIDDRQVVKNNVSASEAFGKASDNQQEYYSSATPKIKNDSVPINAKVETEYANKSNNPTFNQNGATITTSGDTTSASYEKTSKPDNENKSEVHIHQSSNANKDVSYIENDVNNDSARRTATTASDTKDDINRPKDVNQNQSATAVQTVSQTSFSKAFSDAYTKMDIRKIVDSTTNAVGQAVTRELSQTNEGEGIIKTARVANIFIAPLASKGEQFSAMKMAVNIGKNQGNISSNVVWNTNTNQIARVAVRSSMSLQEMTSVKSNDVISKLNADKFAKYGIKVSKDTSIAEMKEIARNHNISELRKLNVKVDDNVSASELATLLKENNVENSINIIDHISATGGLAIKKCDVRITENKKLNELLETKYGKGHILSDNDIVSLLKDKNIRQNADWTKELMAHQKLNGLITKAGQTINLNTEEGVALFVSSLADKNKLKQWLKGSNADVDARLMQKLMARRTGISGFDGKYNKIIKAGSAFTTAEIEADLKNLTLALESLVGGSEAKVIMRMNVKQLQDYIAKCDNASLKTVAESVLASKIQKATLTKAFFKNAGKQFVKQVGRNFRQVARSNGSFAAYYDLKDKLRTIRTLKNGKKTLKRVVNNRRIRKNGRIQNKMASLRARGKAGNKRYNKLAKKSEKLSRKTISPTELNKPSLKTRLKNKAKDKAKEQAKKARDKWRNSVLRGRLANSRAGRFAKGIRDKLLGSVNKFQKSTFGKITSKLLKAPLKFLKAILKFLNAVKKYIIIGVALILLYLIVIDIEMFLVGTIGGAITDFFSPYEDVMQSTAGKTLDALQKKDKSFFELVDSKTEKIAEGDTLSSLDIYNVYGYIDASSSKTGNVKRFNITRPGSPYGVDGFEQHFYNVDENGNKAEVARFSNAKDIISIAYAGYDGKCAKIFSSFKGYCIDLWENTHICAVDNCDKGVYKKGNFHCHASDIFSCSTGKCDGSNVNTYKYYCNTRSSGKKEQSRDQKDTFWVYDYLYKGQTVNPLSDKNTQKYLYVTNGSLATKGLGCKHYTCSTSDKKIYVGDKIDTTNSTTYSGARYWYDGKWHYYSTDYNGNPIYVNALKGTLEDNNEDYCNNSYISYTNSPTVKVNCGGHESYCSSGTYSDVYGNYHIPSSNCKNKKTATVTQKCSKAYGQSYSVTIAGDNYKDYKILNNNSYDNLLVDGIIYSSNKCDKELTINNSAIKFSNFSNGATFNFNSVNCSHKKLVEKVKSFTIRYTRNGKTKTTTGYFKYRTYECSYDGGTKTISYCAGHCNGHTARVGTVVCRKHYTCSGHTLNYCKGHTIAKLEVKILGINNPEIFDKAQIEAKEDVKNRLKSKGTQDWAKSIYDGDWEDLYGIKIGGSFTIPAPLSQSEINSLIKKSETEENTTERQIVNVALQSIGQIPYYSKEGKKLKFTVKLTEENGYDQFKTVLKDVDDNGRAIAGLDGSTYAGMIYWSCGLIGGSSNPSLETTKNSVKKIDDVLSGKAGDILIIGKKTYIILSNKDKKYVCAYMDKEYSNAFVEKFDITEDALEDFTLYRHK